MDKRFLDLIKNKRDNNSKYHSDLAREWYFIGEKDRFHSPLVYSSLEYRMAIERFVFEFMILIKKEEGITIKDENKTVKFESLINHIYKIVGGKEFYMKILRFNYTILSIERPGLKLAELDLKFLYKNWKALSNYCHLNIRPDTSWKDNKNFIDKGYNSLLEMKEYFYENTHEKHLGWYAMNTIPNKEVLDLRNDFINDKIDESALITRYNFMKPILKMRKGIKLL